MTKVNTFIKMNSKLLDTVDDHWLFSEFSEYVEELMGENWHIPTNVELLEGVPQSAKNAVYAWSFHCTASSHGDITTNLFNNDTITDENLLTNLKMMQEVGCYELAERYESALKLASLDKNFIKLNHEQEKYYNLITSEKYDNFKAIDSDLSFFINEDFSCKVANYIRRHKEELFEL